MCTPFCGVYALGLNDRVDVSGLYLLTLQLITFMIKYNYVLRGVVYALNVCVNLISPTCGRANRRRNLPPRIQLVLLVPRCGGSRCWPEHAALLGSTIFQ